MSARRMLKILILVLIMGLAVIGVWTAVVVPYQVFLTIGSWIILIIAGIVLFGMAVFTADWVGNKVADKIIERKERR